MEFSTTIIGLVSIALISLPFVLMSKSRKDREKQLFNSLQAIANKINSSINEFDLGPGFAIGFTSNQQAVVFYKNKNELEVEKVISLDEIQKCKVNSINNTTKSGNVESFVERLELAFVPKNKRPEDLKIELYNAKDSFQLNGEFQLALKWEELINTKLQAN
ncbi:MAG TPA: hypothetical protein PKL31_11180 [Fulvivirga sp.]|nr:hypothetical protein [Fulvivirga sp.]